MFSERESDLPLATGVVVWSKRCFVRAEGEVVPLSKHELALLRVLAHRANEVVSREQLMESVWDRRYDGVCRALDITVTRLRRKIEHVGPPRSLKTAHGDGYRLVIVPKSNRAMTPHRGDDTMALEVDLVRGVVQTPGAGELHLTELERRLLDALLRADGRAVKAEDLARCGWPRCYVAPDTVGKAMRRLRAKLQQLDDETLRVSSVRGGGYRIERRTKVSAADLLEPLWAAAAHVGTVLGCEDCIVYLFDPRSEALVQVAAYGPKNPEGWQIDSPLAIPLGQGIVGAAARTRAAVNVADVREDPRYIADAFHGNSELAVPIMLRDRLLGVIDSESTALHAFGSRHVEAFASLSNVIARSAAVAAQALFR